MREAWDVGVLLARGTGARRARRHAGGRALGRGMMRTMEVRSMLDGDEKAVLAIYQAGIDTGNATFASCAPEWAAWDVGHLASTGSSPSKRPGLTSWVGSRCPGSRTAVSMPGSPRSPST